MLDIFKDELLKTYDNQHPRVNHRGLLALDELADDDDDEQLDDLSDHEEDNWEPHHDDQGNYTCTEEDCEDIDQQLCEDDDELHELPICKWSCATGKSCSWFLSSVISPSTADVVIKKRS